jgi:hypothetical protein
VNGLVGCQIVRDGISVVRSRVSSLGKALKSRKKIAPHLPGRINLDLYIPGP